MYKKWNMDQSGDLAVSGREGKQTNKNLLAYIKVGKYL